MQRTFIPRFAELHFGLIHFYEEADVEHSELVRRLAKPGSQIAKEMTADGAHLLHMIVGVCGEAGELLEAITATAVCHLPLNRSNVVEELGDLEFYLEGLRQGCQITRGETRRRSIGDKSEIVETGGYSLAFHAAVEICIESGKLLDAVKKSVVYQKSLDLGELVRSLSNFEFSMEEFRQSLAITRDETLACNIEKLKVRYASLSYSDHAAQTRADKDE